MAKVKIQGHASGTGVLTVTAPNTSSDRTITLPDATGTLLASEGAVTINDSGADVDFRVESDTKTHALFVQGSDGAIGIGAAPSAPGSDFQTLEIKNVATNGRACLALTGNSSEYSHLHFGDENDQDIGAINYYHGNDNMYFKTNAATQLQITSDGRGLSQFTAKAWVRYDQVADSVLDSHNVSSVDDDATGKFTVNYTVAMANANYCAVGMSEDDRVMSYRGSGGVPTAADVQVQTTHYNGNKYDEDNNGLLVFGD
jgi:hypothetical protein